MYHNRLGKIILQIGLTLCALAMISFIVLLGFYSTYQVNHDLVYLTLLYALLIGYMGPIFLYVGTFFWSRTKGIKIKVIIWILLVIPPLFFVPFPEKCTYIEDVGSCEAIYPNSIEYWKHVVNYFSTETPSEEWESWGISLYIDEGFGDVWKEIKNTQNSLI